MHESIPWFICIYHKHTYKNGAYLDYVAFEPKAYNEEDKILADSSFGFKISETSNMLVPDDLIEMYYSKSGKIHERASFYMTRIMDTNELKDFSIDFIKCDDEDLFYKIVSSNYIFTPDNDKTHQNDRDNSIESFINGITHVSPLYGGPIYWDNGLISKKRG